MALYFDNVSVSNAPQTHVLIIGVGEYPFLKDGVQQQNQPFAYLQSLGQLSSPPKSAAHFFEQVMKLHERGLFNLPLGSVEVLVDEGHIPDYLNEEPTKRNIREAYFRWKDRCNGNEDNVAIFYFAGHGFGLSEHCLLPKDFGEDTRVPFENAIAFDKTQTAFRSCRANTQLFFIDSCRIVPPETKFQDNTFTPLENVANDMLTDKPYTLVMKAASHNEGAFGEKNKPSFFVNALFKGLTCYGAVNGNEGWTVETGDLVKGINNWIKWEKETEGYLQRCLSSANVSFPLVKFQQPPEVSLTMDCKPAEALPFAGMEYEGVNNHIQDQRKPDTVPWKVSLPAGVYKLKAEFINHYEAEQITDSVQPPFTNKYFACKKKMTEQVQAEA